MSWCVEVYRITRVSSFSPRSFRRQNAIGFDQSLISARYELASKIHSYARARRGRGCACMLLARLLLDEIRDYSLSTDFLLFYVSQKCGQRELE